MKVYYVDTIDNYSMEDSIQIRKNSSGVVIDGLMRDHTGWGWSLDQIAATMVAELYENTRIKVPTASKVEFTVLDLNKFTADDLGRLKEKGVF